jgi:hypothetical protein
MRFGKIAIVLAIAVFTANTQCLAACETLLCSDADRHGKPVQPKSDPDCHHSAPSSTPEDAQGDSGNSCTHQTLLGDIGPKTVHLSSESLTFEVVSILPVGVVLQAIGTRDDALNLPPPPLVVTSARILRV